MLPFSKYQGIGNDFLILDGRQPSHGQGRPAGQGLAEAPADPDVCFGLTPERIQRICDRRFGVGGDGLILALPAQQGGDLRMRIFNADGSEPEMCGNGIRCLARFLADQNDDSAGRRWQIETLAGLMVPELCSDGRIRVDMGAPMLRSEAVPTTLPIGEAALPQGILEVMGQTFAVAAAGMGNPHLVIPVDDGSAVDLEALGPALECHPAFPARTNVHFVQVLAPDHLVMRVWERGAGPTLACGTGACATLVACHSLGLCGRRCRVDLPGGSLEIDWDLSSGHVFMTGPAEAVFHGVLAEDLAPEAREPGSSGDEPAIHCATDCVHGCRRPQACPSAEARARVEALLEGRSLDELVAIATQSVELRTRARAERDGDWPA